MAAAIAFATALLYIGIIASQDDNDLPKVVFVAGFIAAMGAGAAAGAFTAASERRLVLLAGAAGGLLTAGVLSLLSIGLPLFAAGVLTTVAWSLARGNLRMTAATALASAAAFVAAAALIVVGSLIT